MIVGQGLNPGLTNVLIGKPKAMKSITSLFNKYLSAKWVDCETVLELLHAPGVTKPTRRFELCEYAQAEFFTPGAWDPMGEKMIYKRYLREIAPGCPKDGKVCPVPGWDCEACEP